VRFFATAAKGTEPALRDELRELRLRGVRADRGGVHFEGQMLDAARACLWSRVGVRVLVEVASFDAGGGAALYEGTRAVDWTTWMTPKTTLAVRATCRSSQLTHSQFVAQKTKDAVVDALRDRFGERPSVDREDPDVLLAVHLARDKATLYLDAGGSSLHERGWRAKAGAAPLRETLAAAVLRLSGWDRARPLVDPMCGAGTIAIEAAAWSRHMAPGLSRKRFGFERWASHGDGERRAMTTMREEARAAAVREGPPVLACDVDPHAVELARDNARSAGVEIVFERRDIRDLAPLEPSGFVVSNPPYGERLAADAGLYDELARALSGMRGHSVALLAGTPAIPAAMRRALKRDADRWWLLFNGPIECRLLVYAL
jgi:putative N6-adenine-specific DNA methylase